MLLSALLPPGPVLGQDSDQDGLDDAFERGVGRYALVAGDFSWPEASADAAARGGHLLTLSSSEEWHAVRTIVGDSLWSTGALWLGATDEVQEGVWRWVTDEPRHRPRRSERRL
jgi:hypothetical protein